MKLKKIKPMFNRLVVTANKYVDANATLPGGIIDATKLKQGLIEYQTVVAVGNTVREIKVGDIVRIDPSRYESKKYDNSVKEDMGLNQVIRYNFPTINLNGEDCLLLYDSDIEYIIEDFEED